MTAIRAASPSEVLYKAASKAAGRRRSVTRRRLPLIIGLVLLAIAILAITFAPLLTSAAPNQIDVLNPLAPPLTPGHLLGTDQFGRDLWSRILYGGRIDLAIAFGATIVTLVGGTIIGLVAGYYGGKIDNVLMRIVDMVLAIPAIFLFILMSILFTPNAITLSMIIASVGWGGVARLVRGETLSVRGRDFMLATRSLGASNLRLMLRHLLPNVLPVMIVAASLGVGAIILAEAALDFLGFGIHPPTASWGNMLSNAQTYFAHSIWLVIFPGIMIFVTVLAANLFGNAVRDAFDPRLR